MSDFEVALERLLAEHGQAVSESGDFVAMRCFADCAAAMMAAAQRRRGHTTDMPDHPEPDVVEPVTTTDLRVMPAKLGKRQGPATNNAMRTRPVSERAAVKQEP